MVSLGFSTAEMETLEWLWLVVDLWLVMLVEFSGVNMVYSHKAVVVQLPKFKMADGRHIENHFLAITRLHIVRLRPKLEW